VPETLAKGKVPAERLRRALELLHELRLALPPENPAPGWPPRATPAAEDCGSLSRYVDFVLRKTALLARLEVLGEPAACLDLFRARAWRAECAGVTLRDWVRTLVTTLHDPPPGQVDSPDAIQFVTCQKAKGLEWPAVIPVGMRREILSHREQFPRVEHHDGLTVIHFSSVTVDRERKAAARAREAEEYQRMLYVTLTRARQSLLVPDGNALYAARQPNYQDLVRWSELAPNALFERPPGIEAPVEGTVPANAEMRSNGVDWFVDDPKLLGEAAEISRRLPRRILPSALVHGAATEIGHSAMDATSARGEEGGRGTNERLFADEQDEAPLASTGGIDYGNWWHEVLERYPWGVQDPVARREFVSRELDRIDQDVRWLERARAELIRLVESAAHADLVEYGGSFLPEMPFSSARASGEWVEGIMDLVVIARTTEAVWIVDWKTDRRRPSDATEAAFLARLAEKYGPQLRAYAAVFAEGFQRPVARLSLYSTETGRFAEVPCDEAVQLSGFRQRAANSSLPPTEAPLLPGWT
jgi:ATP-dependent exoDNAse (exonuclease V) beta subunit